MAFSIIDRRSHRSSAPRGRGSAARGKHDTRDDAPADAPVSAHSLLRPLGIVGYDAVEPALLAALATEEPLLLVSDHGAAKSLLLVRLADALGVVLRHYNASLLQFDDLAGFPVPDERGSGIRYAAPPGAVWDAEAVFLDEIGRCRPETANKLFPIVHERRIQGIPLERLRFRWAATNPPPEAESGDPGADEWTHYEGVEALDPALADRFSYVVPLPRFADLSDADRALIIRGVGARPSRGAARRTRQAVRAARALLPGIRRELGDAATTYVLALAPRLAAAGLARGGRRAATLHRNLLAVRAACVVLGIDDVERAACAALLASVPDVARRQVSRAVLLAAHQAAWNEATIPEGDPRRLLLGVREPARRAALALSLPGLRADLRGEALCDALAALPPHEAGILAWHLLPRVLDGTLVPATASETVAGVVDEVAHAGVVVQRSGAMPSWATELRGRLDREGVPTPELDYLHGVLARAALATHPGGPEPDAIEEVVRQGLTFRGRCVAMLAAPGAAAAEG